MIQQAIKEYKNYIDRVANVIRLYALYKSMPQDILVDYGQQWDEIYYMVLHNDPAETIKEAIIGEGDKDKISNRLEAVKFALNEEWGFEQTWFIEFDEDLFSKEKNPEMFEALTAIKDKEWAFLTMEHLRILAYIANCMVKQLCKNLDSIEGFVKGKTTAVATTPETSPKTSPDFSHTNSFTPTIEFDMSALYAFLINEKVIVNIDEGLFRDCISHANVKELWENGVKSKLKLVIHNLQQRYYPQEWFDAICSNLGMTKQQMGRFNVPKRKEFEQKMTMLK